jgi:hypothetical protein
MNCESFENVVNELARDQMMDAAVLNEALLHSGVCEACALRLEQERALTKNLRGLSAAMHSASASASTEQKLLAQFRHQAIAIAPAVHRSWVRYGVYVAAAAMLLVVIGIAAWRAQVTPNTPKQTASVVQEPKLSGVSPTTQITPSKPFETVQVARPPRTEFKRKVATAQVRAAKKATDRTAAVRAPNPVEHEVTTEFVAVSYSNPISVQDGGQIVRVELPRAAMARFGLPVNMDRYDERVKADVLVGPDGLARAIRFVQ